MVDTVGVKSRFEKQIFLEFCSFLNCLFVGKGRRLPYVAQNDLEIYIVSAQTVSHDFGRSFSLSVVHSGYWRCRLIVDGSSNFRWFRPIKCKLELIKVRGRENYDLLIPAQRQACLCQLIKSLGNNYSCKKFLKDRILTLPLVWLSVVDFDKECAISAFEK